MIFSQIAKGFDDQAGSPTGGGDPLGADTAQFNGERSYVDLAAPGIRKKDNTSGYLIGQAKQVGGIGTGREEA